MKNQFEQIIWIIVNLNIETKLHLSITDDRSHFIPVLYSIENNAYFLYQLSSIYTDILNRYVLDQTASIGQYIVLLTDEKRFATLSNLSQQFSDTLHEIEKLFIEHQNEFETNNKVLQEAYDKHLNEFLDRSSTSKMLEIK